MKMLVASGSQSYSSVLLEKLNRCTIVCDIVKHRLLDQTMGLTSHARVDGTRWFLLSAGL